MRAWALRGLLGAVGLVAVAALAVWASTGFGRSLGGTLDGSRLAEAERWDNFEAGVFVNLEETPLAAPGRDADQITRYFTVDSVRTPPSPMPIEPRTASDFASPPSYGLQVVWVGHSTSIVDINGVRVLIDPMLSHRASPSPWMGPSRYHALPLPLDELPEVDIAVVSHDHYDHLDMPTVEALAAQGTVFVVPLGIGAHLEAWDVPADQIVDLTWWAFHDIGPVRVHCVPARHYSGRGPFDQNEALWSGWVLEGRDRSLYYSGDTGPGDHFAAIGRMLGPFDITLVKIGEYDETWPFIHIDPEEAVQAHLDARGTLLVPVHWGTFNLAYHDWDEPIRRVTAAARGAGVAIGTPRPGGRVVAGEPPPTEAWWEAVR